MHDHPRIAAWLHIVSGLCILVTLSGLLAFAAAYHGSAALPEDLKGKLGTVALVLGTALSVVAGLEILGGVAFLNGKGFGRPLLLLSSALHVANLPFGTALSMYTFWAFARRTPPH